MAPWLLPWKLTIFCLSPGGAKNKRQGGVRSVTPSGQAPEPHLSQVLPGPVPSAHTSAGFPRQGQGSQETEGPPGSENRSRPRGRCLPRKTAERVPSSSGRDRGIQATSGKGYGQAPWRPPALAGAVFILTRDECSPPASPMAPCTDSKENKVKMQYNADCFSCAVL